MRAVLWGVLVVGLTVVGQAEVQAQAPKSAPLAQRAAPGMEVDTNRFGSDYRGFDAPSAQLCQTACVNEQACRAWTWVKPGIQGPGGKCWLKNQVPPATANSCCVSGSKTPLPQTATKAPAQQSAMLSSQARFENPRAKQDQQRFVDGVRQQNALANDTWKAVLSERGAQNFVEQGIIKAEVTSINKQKPAGYVFRPGASFTVVGRGLGANGTLRLGGLFRNPVPIVITGWRPGAILASLGPDISGEIDMDGVRLEIFPVGAAPIIVQNLRFEAAREPITVTNLPQRYVKLPGWPARYTTNGQRPAPADYSQFLKANKPYSAIVTRENRGKEWFAPGTDFYSLGLSPQFKISYIGFEFGLKRTSSSQCMGSSGGEYFQGNYAYTPVSDHEFKVDWGVWRCHSSPKFAGVTMLPADDLNGSAYALEVIVVGPRGTDPWIR